MAVRQPFPPDPPRTPPPPSHPPATPRALPYRSTVLPRSLLRTLVWPAAAVGFGALLIGNSLDDSVDAKPPPSAALAAPPTQEDRGDTAAPHRELPRSAPQRISIPGIAVTAPFTGLSLDSSGRLQAPPANDSNLVGWYRDGASPGERGTSIVVGHVDTKTGPAVFVRLSELKPGSTVDITRADGVVATFKVDSVNSFSKKDFPDEKVYADAPNPQLRLITCGGDYDRKAKDYKENVVVFAHLASAGSP